MYSESTTPKDYIVKICAIGEGSVGKTSMVLQYCEKKFKENYIMTIGSNFAIKMLKFPDHNPPVNVRLQLWDLAGQMHFEFVRPPFYRGASGVVIVFDLTRRDSFDAVENWKKEAESVVPNIPILLVGNKLDLEEDRVVTHAEGVKKAKALGAEGYFETSAKTGENLTDCFLTIVKKVIKLE